MSKSNFDNNQNYFNFIDNKTIPLVFVHGVGLDHKMWNSQIKSFLNFEIEKNDQEKEKKLAN